MKIAKTENGTNASIIVTGSGNATQPMRTAKMTTMAEATMTTLAEAKALGMANPLSMSLAEMSDQENGTTGKCEKPS